MNENPEQAPKEQLVVSRRSGEPGLSVNPDASSSGARLQREDEILHLVQRIFFVQGGLPPQIVVFTAVSPGDGSGEVCMSVARALTKISSGSVCVIEADMKRPSSASDLGLSSTAGLRDAWAQDVPITTYAQKLKPDNLWLLPAGSGTIAPGLVGTEAFRNRVMELKSRFDVVLIDCTSINQSADAISLGRWTDGLILVLEANATRREDAVEATQVLRSAGVSILAAVLNNRVSAMPAFLEKRL